MTHARGREHGDFGFTVMELAVTMVITGILGSISVFGFWTWQATAQQRGSTSELASQLRNASERAIAKGRTMCVDLATDGRTYTVYEHTCGTGTPVAGPFKAKGERVTFAVSTAAATATASCPASHSCLYFYPRGTAIPGTIAVSSSARSNVYNIHVEGLTSRVWT